MIKVKISYEQEDDLKELMSAIRPMITRCKRREKQDGKYKKIYIEIGDSCLNK